MEEKKPKIYLSDIHLENYTEQYEGKQATAADVVFMNSSLTAIIEAIRIAKRALRVSKQNVIFALGIKAIVMILGLCGMASMWMAVFADSGVAMLCVLNSIRILYKK